MKPHQCLPLTVFSLSLKWAAWASFSAEETLWQQISLLHKAKFSSYHFENMVCLRKCQNLFSGFSEWDTEICFSGKEKLMFLLQNCTYILKPTGKIAVCEFLFNSHKDRIKTWTIFTIKTHWSWSRHHIHHTVAATLLTREGGKQCIGQPILSVYS